MFVPFRKCRAWSVALLAVSASVVVLFIPAEIVAHELRMFGYYLAGRRVDPVVRAIAQYERERGRPPSGTGFLNWDTFIYLPAQNYAECNFSVRQLGAWGYVFE